MEEIVWIWRLTMEKSELASKRLDNQITKGFVEILGYFQPN